MTSVYGRAPLRRVAVLLAMAVLAACGGSGGGGGNGNLATVSAGAGTGGSIAPESAAVENGGNVTLTVTPDAGYSIAEVAGCGGTLAGDTYTTGAITADCTVTASFVQNHTVTASAGSGGAITPASQTVNHGLTTSFTLAPDMGYVVGSITGCDGTLSGNTYTTGAIAADCAVTASFVRSFSWKGAELIESDNAGNAEFPQIAFDTSGNAMAVWSQSDGTRFNIWAKYYVAGTGWGAEELIEIYNAGHASAPQIAFDASGNAMAVWSQFDGTRYNIFAKYYVAGMGWEVAELIETDNAGSANLPQIALDPSGNAIAVWYQQDGTRNNIWANRYIAGSGWVGATKIETNDAGGAAYPQISCDASGNAIAVWTQDDGTGHNIWANRYVAGSGWSGAAKIETANAGPFSFPQIAFDASSGAAIAVWQQPDGTSSNIWANRYAPGLGWGTARLIETDDIGDAYDPQIAFDASGNAITVWSQYDDTRANILANRYVAGAGWSAATKIETDDAGNATRPQIAFDASGNAMAVWTQSDGTRINVLANRYTAATGWGAPTTIGTDEVGYVPFPQIAVDPNGNAIAVWDQSDATRGNIWANRFE